ncbi:MAG: 2'-5' RNA ligase family protein [Phycisphaerae bacterium]|nr:2'-5' RNA ligase family protein [Phycisphaerae bacterium]
MSRIAVDVVLLPDEAMTDKAIEINAELVKRFGNEIELNKENCLPHISLAMGCIEEADIASVEKVLEEIAKETSLPDLKVVGIRASGNSKGQTISVFEVEKTEELQSLHEEVMDKLAPYLSSDVTEDMIYGDQAVAGSTLLWIKNYREKVSFENFFPHITIGYGQIENQVLPDTFSVLKFALCHLGNHCTCRKVLVSIEIRGV